MKLRHIRAPTATPRGSALHLNCATNNAAQTVNDGSNRLGDNIAFNVARTMEP